LGERIWIQLSGAHLMSTARVLQIDEVISIIIQAIGAGALSCGFIQLISIHERATARIIREIDTLIPVVVQAIRAGREGLVRLIIIFSIATAWIPQIDTPISIIVQAVGALLGGLLWIIGSLTARIIEIDEAILIIVQAIRASPWLLLTTIRCG